MSSKARWILLVLVAFCATSILAPCVEAAEPHAVTSEEIDALLATRSVDAPPMRETLREFVRSPRAEELARVHRLDLQRVQDAVETLDAEELESLAPYVERFESSLAGGDRVVISATSLVIILLLVLIIAD